MQTLKLISTFIKINFQVAMAYRVDTAINILLSMLWLGWELLSLSIIFHNTQTLGGWGPGELVALLGVFHLVNMVMGAVIWPATEKFNSSVRDGSLDYTLLQPANSLFLISFSRVVLWRIWDLFLGFTLVGVGVRMSGGGASTFHLASFLVLVGSGMLVIYSLWVVLIAATFWFIKFDNNVTILQALMDSGRYPATIYPPWLRVIVTFVIPIAVATTVPLQALRGELSGLKVLMFIGIGIASLLVASQIWKAGVRKYSGASS